MKQDDVLSAVAWVMMRVAEVREKMDLEKTEAIVGLWRKGSPNLYSKGSRIRNCVRN